MGFYIADDIIDANRERKRQDEEDTLTVAQALTDGLSLTGNLSFESAAIRKGFYEFTTDTKGPKIAPEEGKKIYGSDIKIDFPATHAQWQFFRANKDFIDSSFEKGLDAVTSGGATSVAAVIGGVAGLVFMPSNMLLGGLFRVAGSLAKGTHAYAKAAKAVGEVGSRLIPRTAVNTFAALKGADALIRIGTRSSKLMKPAITRLATPRNVSEGLAGSVDIVATGIIDQSLGNSYNYLALAPLGIFAPAAMTSMGIALKAGIKGAGKGAVAVFPSKLMRQIDDLADNRISSKLAKVRNIVADMGNADALKRILKLDDESHLQAKMEKVLGKKVTDTKAALKEIVETNKLHKLEKEILNVDGKELEEIVTPPKQPDIKHDVSTQENRLQPAKDSLDVEDYALKNDDFNFQGDDWTGAEVDIKKTIEKHIKRAKDAIDPADKGLATQAYSGMVKALEAFKRCTYG